MRVRAVLLVAMFIAGTVAVHAAEQPAKPEWQTVAIPTGEVVIFGNIGRPGYYSLPEQGLSLKALVASAGAPEKIEGVVIQLRRHVGKDAAKIIEVKMSALAQDGNIALEPNDIIQVLSAKTAG